MQKVRTIIVDDEFEAREGLKTLLVNDTEIDLLGLCKNGIEAIDMINGYKVDLMFLDIQMPLINGFEVVNSISKERLPHIIFVTAYDQYALKAFEVHAIDYILKPFTSRRFQEGLMRAKQLIRQQQVQSEKDKLKRLSESFMQQDTSSDQNLIQENNLAEQRLIVKEKGKVHFVGLHDIIWLQAYDYYVKIHVKKRYYLIRESLKKLEENLPSNLFIRVHKSSIINQQFVEQIKLVGSGEYMINLKNGAEVKSSRTYKDTIKDLLNR